MIGYEVQPHCWPSVSASSRQTSPVATLRKPSTSKRPTGVGPNLGRSRTAAITPRMPTGTLMKKISRQSTYSTRYPPSVGPTAGATMMPRPYMPIAAPIFCRGTIL